VILDTNVLVYAVGAEHPLRGPARRLITALRDGELQATTSVLVLQEFTYVYARRRGPEAAAGLARSYIDLLEPLIPVEQPHLMTALRLLERYDVRPSDALLAAAALHTSQTIVTADKALGGVPDVTTAMLASDVVDRLIDAS
jgi:predicted nucleic acid-binding protein